MKPSIFPTVTLRNEKADEKKRKKAEATMKATQDIYYKRRNSRQANDRPKPVYNANDASPGAIITADPAAKKDTSKEHRNEKEIGLLMQLIKCRNSPGRRQGNRRLPPPNRRRGVFCIVLPVVPFKCLYGNIRSFS